MRENDLIFHSSSLSWQVDKFTILFYRFFIRNCFIKIFLFLLFLIGILVMTEELNFMELKSISPYILFTLALGKTVENFYKKIAYEIKIFPEYKKLTLKMFGSEEEKDFNFNDIKQIYVSVYLVFFINGKKIFFGGGIDETLLCELTKIQKIKWGILCFITNIPKEYREKY